MSKHTSGPWAVAVPAENECQLGAGHYVNAADGEGVAYAQRSPDDACLIARAPAMREALDELRALIESGEMYASEMLRIIAKTEA